MHAATGAGGAVILLQCDAGHSPGQCRSCSSHLVPKCPHLEPITDNFPGLLKVPNFGLLFQQDDLVNVFEVYL